MKTLSLSLILALIAPAPTKPSATDPAARSRAMRAIVDAIRAEEDGKPIEWGAEALYRYDDPTRGWTDGTIWALGNKQGRPKALMTLTLGAPNQGRRTWLYELTTLTDTSLSVIDGNHWSWTPQRTPPAFTNLQSETAPDLDDSKRLRQIKELSKKFKAHEYTGSSAYAGTPRYELRLLPRPICRYSDPTAGLVDGAIFVLAHGTNPEAAVLIEARQEGKAAPTWSWAVARVSGAEMHVSIDDTEVWTVPVQPRSTTSFPYCNTYKVATEFED